MNPPNNNSAPNVFEINGAGKPGSLRPPNLDSLSDDEELVMGYLILGISPAEMADTCSMDPEQVNQCLGSIYNVFGINPDSEDRPAAALEVFDRLAAEERRQRDSEHFTSVANQRGLTIKKGFLHRIK